MDNTIIRLVVILCIISLWILNNLIYTIIHDIRKTHCAKKSNYNCNECKCWDCEYKECEYKKNKKKGD